MLPDREQVRGRPNNSSQFRTRTRRPTPPRVAYGGRALPFHEPAAVQRAKLFRHKFAIPSDDFAIEANFAAAILRTLNTHHVPVHLASIAIVTFLVCLARREVKGAADFFVEQNVPPPL